MHVGQDEIETRFTYHAPKPEADGDNAQGLEAGRVHELRAVLNALHQGLAELEDQITRLERL